MSTENEQQDTNNKATPVENGTEKVETEEKKVTIANPEQVNDVEGGTKKLPYPKSVFFIISNEFCERFNYYGMRTILVLYLTRKLHFDDDTATVIYHAFTTLVYFSCIFGAIISDSWWGKFKTILYISMLYTAGSTILSVGAIPTLNLPARETAYLGLLLIALGSGGIKPCVAAFGGDQFKLPAQAAQMAMFFSLFYFSINSGSLISTALTPILRQDVHCFNEKDCYSLAFGVPGALMAVSILIFFLGKPLYKIIPPSGNMVVLVAKCVSNAISEKGKQKNFQKRNHWLDYAEDKYGKQLVRDTKVLLKILVLYIPLPVFWALFDQQGSRWTFQATRMDGDLGFYEIKPDQMQVINPFLILAFIPLYETLFYPLLSKIGIRRPLQKLTAGGILAGVAFLISAFVELELEKTYPVLPDVGESQLRVFNGLACDYRGTVDIPNFKEFTIKSMAAFEEKHIRQKSEDSHKFKFTSLSSGNADCPNEITGTFTLKSKSARSIFLTGNSPYVYDDEPNKSPTGNPLIRFLANTKTSRKLTIRSGNSDAFVGDTTNRKLIELSADDYHIYVDAEKVLSIDIRQGSVNTIILRESDKIHHSVIQIAAPNQLSMLWLVPQYVIMTLGEVMYSVTGLAFSYSQAPESMKSVLQACWLLAVAFGNVLVMFIAGARFFSSQAHEFFLFSGLMFADMILFMFLAYNYKSGSSQAEEDSDTAEVLTSDKEANGDIDSKQNDTSTILPAVPPVPEVTEKGKVNDGFKGE